MVPLHWFGHRICAVVCRMSGMQLSDFAFGYSHLTVGRFLTDMYVKEPPSVIANRGRFVGCDPLQ